MEKSEVYIHFLKICWNRSNFNAKYKDVYWENPDKYDISITLPYLIVEE